MKTHPLLRALKVLMPDASFTVTSSRDWCSMTFAGQQLTVECVTMCEHKFVRSLPTHEFSIPNMLVAEIAVVGSEKAGDATTLLIDALLLDV